jgi:hypothetical protein
MGVPVPSRHGTLLAGSTVGRCPTHYPLIKYLMSAAAAAPGPPVCSATAAIVHLEPYGLP